MQRIFMSIRQKMNDNPSIGIGVTAVVILIAVTIIWFQLSGGTTESPDTAFYTIDEGRTYFEGDVNQVVPFEHEGKQALRAFVYQCGNDAPFVGVVGRYNAQGRREMEDYIKNNIFEKD